MNNYSNIRGYTMSDSQGKPDADEFICQTRHVHLDSIRRAQGSLPDARDLEGLAETFKILSDPNRLKIVLALAEEELCVCDISALLGISESATSHQLRLLRTLRLVRPSKRGKMVYYSLDDEHITGLVEQGLTHVREES